MSIKLVSDLSLFDADANSRTTPFKGGVDDITRDSQETVDLMRGSIIRAMAKKIEEENKGMVAMFENSFYELTWYELEREKEDQKALKDSY